MGRVEEGRQKIPRGGSRHRGNGAPGRPRFHHLPKGGLHPARTHSLAALSLGHASTSPRQRRKCDGPHHYSRSLCLEITSSYSKPVVADIIRTLLLIQECFLVINYSSTGM